MIVLTIQCDDSLSAYQIVNFVALNRLSNNITQSNENEDGEMVESFIELDELGRPVQPKVIRKLPVRKEKFLEKTIKNNHI